MTARKVLLLLGVLFAAGGGSFVIWRDYLAPRPASPRPERVPPGPKHSPDPIAIKPAREIKLGLDEATHALLLQRVRERARALRPQDLARLPQDGKILAPLRLPHDPAPSAQGSTPAASLAHGLPASVPDTPALPAGYHPQVFVQAPGRLDWTFVRSYQSLNPEAARRMHDYASADQSYELYVPPSYRHGEPAGLILHVPVTLVSDGSYVWGPICQRHGFLLAGVHNAGNGPGAIERPQRMRTVLDVLDDVRRRFSIDPDRTYITGGSGAGNAASRIAFALPELFGGLVAICGTWSMRREPWLRQRAAERLSVAVLTGEFDFNRPELELEWFPILREHGVRSLLRVYAGMGHGTPNESQLEEVFRWLEEGLPERRRTADRYPASRLTGAPTPDEWSTAMLQEAAQRLASPEGLAAGLFLIQGVAERWSGSPPAEFAEKLLHEFDAHSAVPWKEIDRAEKLRYAYLEARAYDVGYAAPPPPNYPVSQETRRDIAIELWSRVLRLAPDGSDVERQAKVRLEALRHRRAGRVSPRPPGPHPGMAPVLPIELLRFFAVGCLRGQPPSRFRGISHGHGLRTCTRPRDPAAANRSGAVAENSSTHWPRTGARG